jgi:hypothetical protein
MISPDLVNALFECWGAVCTWRDVAALRRSRQVSGVLASSRLFFAAWGAWNLYFYPSVGAPLSAIAGAVIFVGNVTWYTLAMRLKWHDRKRSS